MQIQERKHVWVCVDRNHLAVECFGTVDTERTPAAANLHHIGLVSGRMLVQIVHDEITGEPDLVAVNFRLVGFRQKLLQFGVVFGKELKAANDMDVGLFGHNAYYLDDWDIR